MPGMGYLVHLPCRTEDFDNPAFDFVVWARAKVERARTVLADPEAKGEVLAGKKTISRAAKEVKRKRNRKPKSKPESPNPLNEGTRPIRLMEAWEELRMWRNRYAHLGDEFREVFSIIDAKGTGENLR